MKKNEESEIRDKIKEQIILQAQLNRVNMDPSLGITQTYNLENRDKLWDSAKRKKDYKDKVFNGKKTIKDPISGNTLHSTQQAAQRKYHMKNKEGDNISTAWAKHSPETDHIVSLKEIHSRTRNNAFLKDQDLKEIGNQDYNYRITSKSFNASKGEQSDLKIVRDNNLNMDQKAKNIIIKEKIGAELKLNTNIATHSIKNIGNEFYKGGKHSVENSVIPLTVEAVNHLCLIARGDENLGEAVEDIGKIVFESAVTGGTKRLLVDEAIVLLNDSKSKLLQNLALSNKLDPIISVGLMVKDSACKYINGEINEIEFVEEVGQKGKILVAGLIGGEVGREIGFVVGGAIGTLSIPLPVIGTVAGAAIGEIVGKVLGVLITSVACSAIISMKNFSKNLNDHKLQENKIRKIEIEALSEMSHQREYLKTIINTEYKKWDEAFQVGFDMILSNACEKTFSAEGVAEGLDRILSVFGKKVAFKDKTEYLQQIDKTLVLEL